MDRKEKIQLLVDLHTGKKHLSDLVKPKYENLSTPELTRLHDGVIKIHNKEMLTIEEESDYKIILGKLYNINPKVFK